jgi:hypothetical protein
VALVKGNAKHKASSRSLTSDRRGGRHAKQLAGGK